MTRYATLPALAAMIGGGCGRSAPPFGGGEAGAGSQGAPRADGVEALCPEAAPRFEERCVQNPVPEEFARRPALPTPIEKPGGGERPLGPHAFAQGWAVDGETQGLWEETTGATADAGESRTVTVSLAAIRDRVLAKSPACLRERRGLEAGAR